MSPPPATLVIASNNPHKASELRALLHDVLGRVLTLAEALGGRTLTVDEDGATFAANARKKGEAAANATGLFTLADDSGLEVDALGGLPGVRSARFAHDHATDDENNQALLHALHHLPPAERRARYRCVLVLHGPPASRELLLVEGTCEGAIAEAPRGTCGFGYDPLFLPDAHPGKTMAELSAADKNLCSHRGHALRALASPLREILASHFPTMAGTRA